MNKIDFLQRQNQQLRDQLQDLRQMIKLNKVQIDILSSQLQTHNNTKFIDLIISYRQRQNKMQTNIVQLKQQLAQLASDNLVLRQMNEGQIIEMKNMEGLNSASTELLNKKIVQLEQKLAFYQKSHKEYDKVSGFVLKNRDIFGPQESAMELKNKQYDWEDQISLQKAQVQMCKKNQKQLMIVNSQLRSKIISLQAQLAMPNRSLGEVLDKSLKKLMLYFIEVQKKIITGQEDSDSDEQNDIELIAPELSGIFPEKQLRIQRDYGVPHLDLLKIKQQMNHTSNKVKEALIARNHLTDRQKLQRLQIQLQYTRRQLSKNIIDLRQQKEKRKKAQRNTYQLEARANLLIQSNLHLQEKVKKYWQKLKVLRQKLYSRESLDTTKGAIIDEEPYHNLDQTLKIKQPLLKKQKDKSKIMALDKYNLSILLSQFDIDYKINLQIMAKQLEQNKRLQKILNRESKIQEKQPLKKLRIKRGLSDPFLYFNQRRENIMEINQGAELNQRQRLEQTCYNPGQVVQLDDVLNGYESDDN